MRFRTFFVLPFLGIHLGLPAALTVEFVNNQLTVTSDTDSDTITLTEAGGQLLLNGGNPGGIPITAADVTRIEVEGGEGNDTIDVSALDETSGLVSLFNITLNGGSGSDEITGSALGNSISGGPGDDTLSGGSEGDGFSWNRGDGADMIDAGGGSDSFGANALTDAAQFAFLKDGGDVLLQSNEGGVVETRIAGVETLNLGDGPGDDMFVVGDLEGTGVTRVLMNLGEGMNVVDASDHGGEILCSHMISSGSLQFTGAAGAFHTVQINNAFTNDPLERSVTNDSGFVRIDTEGPDVKTVRCRDVSAAIVRLQNGDDVVTVSDLGDDTGVTRLTVFGDDGDDSVTTRPQAITLQDLRGEGEDSVDTLVIDMQNMFFEDDGFTITPLGQADILYSGWESMDIQNLPPPGDQWAVTGN